MVVLGVMCFFKQMTAYYVRISDWSSDVCSSDLLAELRIDKARTCVGGFEVGATLIVDRQQDAVAIAVRQIGGRTVSFELRRFERHGVLPTPQQRDKIGRAHV